jgi:hypothetical protein
MLDERCEINNEMLEENGALLSYYAASGGSLLRTFRFNISYLSSRIKNIENYS